MGFFNFFDYESTEHVVSFDLTIPNTTCTPTRVHPTLSNPTLPHIPLELILLILEHTSSADYQSCSLVCHSWSLPAQRLLFQHVSLSSQSAALSFLASITSSPALADAVQTLSGSIDHNQPFGLSQRAFAHAFTLCRNISSLSISLYGCASPGKDIVGAPDAQRMRRPAPSFDDETLALLRAGPRVNKLRFNNWSENRQSVTQLLEVFPQLEELVISGTPPEVPSDSTPPSCQLSSLRMNFQSSPSTDFLQWLLHSSSSSQSLKSLCFDREPPAPVLEFLLNTHRETLESLSLPSFPLAPLVPGTNGTKENTLISSLSNLGALKSFSVEDPTSFAQAVKRLPSSIQQLAFGIEKDTSTVAVVECIRSKQCLESVKVLLWGDEEAMENKSLSSLKMACAVKGVELEVMKDMKRFRDVGL